MPEYAWVVSGPETRELTEARSRRLNFAVDGGATASFTMSGLSEEAAAIQELQTDLTVYRDGTKIFRGRIMAEQDSVTADGHTVTFAVKDYRGLLEYRTVGTDGLSWSGVDQFTIAWEMIEHTQDKVNGDLGIVEGLGSTDSGQARTRELAPGTTIAEALQSLGRLQNGFEWEIDAERALNRWFTRRGGDNGVRLDYGGLVSSLSRSLAPDFANVAQVQGAGGTNPAESVSAALAADPRGRWEISRGYPTITEQSTVDARADWVLEETATSRPGFATTLTQGVWEGPDHIWLGDLAELQVKSGRLNVSSQQRVVTLGLPIGDDGTETVHLGLIDAEIGS